MRDHLVRFVTPSPEALSEVRAAVASFLALGLSRELRSAMLLALDEIITNAVTHSGTDGPISLAIADSLVTRRPRSFIHPARQVSSRAASISAAMSASLN